MMLGEINSQSRIYLTIGKTTKGKVLVMRYLSEPPTAEQLALSPLGYDSRVSGAGKTIWHQLYGYVAGRVERVASEKQKLGEVERDVLRIYLSGNYCVTVGDFDNSWSIGLLKALANPNFGRETVVFLHPYSYTKAGKNHSGVSVKMGKEWDSAQLKWAEIGDGYAPPAAKEIIRKGVKEWDYWEVATWLLNYVSAKLQPVTEPVAEADNQGTEDDLPF